MKKHLTIIVIIIAMISFLSCKKENTSTISRAYSPPVVPAQPIPSYPEGAVPDAILIGQLSHPGSDIAATVCLDKLFFASTDSGNIATAQTLVDVFDLRTFDNTTFPLSRNRRKITAVAAGSQVFFAGGYDGAPVSRVDIYDLTNNSWSSSELSIPRYSMAATALGNKVYFAGGINASGGPVTRVDIYDISAKSWTSAELSEGRSNLAAGAIGDLLLFCGGRTLYNNQSSIVDIFNTSTNNWSVTHMPFEAKDCKSQVLDNILYVGGSRVNNGELGPIVNVFQNSSVPWPNGFNFPDIEDNMELGASNGHLAVIGQRKMNTSIMIDINIATDMWNRVPFKNDIQGEAIISHDNFLYIAGGVINAGTKRISGVYRFKL